MRTFVENVNIVANNEQALIDIEANLIDIQKSSANGILATDKALEATYRAWDAEATRLTSDSYATEAEDVFVKTYVSNNDGTFTATDTTEYSSFHWKQKSSLASVGSAENISYNNTTSGLISENLQDSTDELSGKVDTNTTSISNNATSISNNATAIGNNATAVGNNATAIGNNATAIGNNATAIGNNADLITIVDSRNISTATSNVLINQEALALELFTILKGFATVTYTGNGTSQDIVTGINSVDFTVSGNVSGYWLDRTTNQVKTDAGVVHVGDLDLVINTSKVHIKSRSGGDSHVVVDGLRGDDKVIRTDNTAIESTFSSDIIFNSNVVTVGNNNGVNQNLATYVAYQELYTHIKVSTTSQGKFQIEAYNPISGMGMIYYIGSGVTGHEISHSQDVELDYYNTKDLTDAYDWQTQINSESSTHRINDSSVLLSSRPSISTAESINISTQHVGINTLNSEYIMYYKRKSLNWTIGAYQSTGVIGNFIETIDINGDIRQPRRVIIKELDDIGNWCVYDSERQTIDDTSANVFYLNLSNAEITSTTSYSVILNENGFTINHSGDWLNNGRYLYMIEFDTNSDGGDGYFNNPTDDSNLVATDADFTYTLGKGVKGLIRGSERYSGSIDFATANDGINWIGKKYGLDEFIFLEEKPLVVSEIPTGIQTEYQFNIDNGKWYDLDSTEVAEALSFSKEPYMVASGTPQEARPDVSELSTNVTVSLEVAELSRLNGNRKIIEIGTIFNDNRYVIDNPFGNENYEDCDVSVEIYHDGMWGRASESGSSAGPSAGNYYSGIISASMLEGIVVQTGYTYLTFAGNQVGMNTFVNSATLTSSPARVIVTYIGEAK